MRFERFHEHVASLRQRSFAGIHQQQHAVDDLQRALDFAAEVGVPRSIDDVYFVVAIAHAGGLGQNRNPALALQLAGIERAVGDILAFAEDPTLPGTWRLLMLSCRDPRGR